jgi:predicted aspartyl protease
VTDPRKIAVFAAALIGAWTVMSAPPAHADDSCTLQRILKLDMSTTRDGHVSVPMTIGGKTVRMLVDTGGVYSMLTPPMVAELGLRPQIIPLSRFRQYGGFTIDHYVAAHDIALGGLHGAKLDMLVMPEHGYAPDTDGLLAPDIMRGYDADFDFANATFSLFSKDHCEGHVVYWTHDPYGVVEIRMNDAGQIIVPVLLDGKEIRAMIDTGAWHSAASLETVEDEFNIDEKNPDLHLIPGENPAHPRYRYPFKTLSFQSVTINNPDLALVPDSQSKQPYDAPKILLGINVLKRLHIYVAYGEHKLYVTPVDAH